VKLRLAFFIMCVALLLAALKYERHEVLPLSEMGKKAGIQTGKPAGKPGGEQQIAKQEAEKPVPAQILSGLEFTQEATVDGFLRRDGLLYDVYSLGPLSSEADVALAVEKKCPT